jgi:hypothetical protein
MSTRLLDLTPLQPAIGICGQPTSNTNARQLWRQLITVVFLSCQGDFHLPIKGLFLLKGLSLQTSIVAGFDYPTSATPPLSLTTVDSGHEPTIAARFHRPAPRLIPLQGHPGSLHL